MLRVVLENLLANAIRYAGAGTHVHGRGLRVRTKARCSPSPTTARAFDGATCPRLFERFYRGDQARTSRGTGLGLAIVKHVVTAAGGEVEATSEAGHGLQIQARFPRG